VRLLVLVGLALSCPVRALTVAKRRHEGVSNVGKDGYEGMVRKLRERIIDGDFIQVVPSQRIAREIGVHPFNVYQQLRKLNPSRYTFYVDCDDFQLGTCALCAFVGRRRRCASVVKT
jgi:anthranilate synthase component 1